MEELAGSYSRLASLTHKTSDLEPPPNMMSAMNDFLYAQKCTVLNYFLKIYRMLENI
jgi:hypothetical protein